MKFELSPYKTLFKEIIPYVENGEVFFECVICNKQPQREDVAQEGMPTQAYFTCECFKGACSLDINLLSEMKEYSISINLI